MATGLSALSWLNSLPVPPDIPQSSDVPPGDAADEIEFTIPNEMAGKRLDVAVALCHAAISRTRAGDLFRDGAILVGGKPVKPSVKVRGGEQIAIDLPEPAELSAAPENIPLSVIFEDRDIIVVNKPAGMVSHPSAGHATGSLVNALLYHCKDLSSINGTLRPGIVHRLDRDTTGAIVSAKNDAAHRALAEQFAAREVKKEYMALCHGSPPKDKFECAGRIGRHPTRRTEMTVLKDADEGREAFTEFEVVERFKGGFFLVRALPRTGRTHQIRVHLKSQGYPILSDPLYGREASLPELGLTRHALHARRLTVTHPVTKARMTFEAPLPQDMVGAMENLRG